MKKIVKVLAFIFIANFLMGSSLYGWVAYSVIVPSLAGTGITITDLVFKKNLDPEMAMKLQQNVNERSVKLGNDAASKVLKGFTILFVPSNLSKSTNVKYPALDEKAINDIQAKAVQKGLEEGLQNLKDADKSYDVIKKQTLQSP